jgi:hypothetical protein
MLRSGRDTTQAVICHIYQQKVEYPNRIATLDEYA